MNRSVDVNHYNLQKMLNIIINLVFMFSKKMNYVFAIKISMYINVHFYYPPLKN